MNYWIDSYEIFYSILYLIGGLYNRLKEKKILFCSVIYINRWKLFWSEYIVNFIFDVILSFNRILFIEGCEA
jgi:hypothetical protein